MAEIAILPRFRNHNSVGIYCFIDFLLQIVTCKAWILQLLQSFLTSWYYHGNYIMSYL